MLVFLKRLVGVEEAQVREGERFKRNLNGFDERQEKLGEIEEQLTELLSGVQARQARIRARPRSSMSGEHQLELKRATTGGIGGNKGRP